MNRQPTQHAIRSTYCIAIAALFMATAPDLCRAEERGTAPQWRFATRLYGDEKARRIGDLITVIIEEQSSASRSAERSGGKSLSGGGSASVGHPTYTRVQNGQAQEVTGPWIRANLPAFDWQFSHDHSGGGQMSSEEGLTSTLTARVLDVLPNGNLLIEGRRVVELQEEKIEVILTGLVRPRDITAANTVSSSRMADASIRYDTAGPLTRDQRRGIFSRLFNWLNPF